MRKIVFLAVVLAMLPRVSQADELNVGVQFQGWNSNYLQPFNGYEIWAPLNCNFKLNPDISLYGQTEYGMGSYTSSLGGDTQTLNLNDISDTILGTEIHFKSLGQSSLVNVEFNIPTGNQSWETEQIPANIPTEYIDTRYRGRGFGVNALYGLSFPSGSGEFGAAAGYAYAGAFNPSYGLNANLTSQLKLGDALFLALDHVQPFTGNQTETISLSAFQSFPTQEGGQDVYELGTNFNASYKWANPKAFSFEVGGQAWLPGQLADSNGNLTSEPFNYLGPRFYLNPSYAFGDFVVAGRAKYIFPNGYTYGNAYYDGGGFLFGIEPSIVFKLGSDSGLKFFTSFDDVIQRNAAPDINDNLTNVIYNRWTFGSNYEVKL
jgi:hypothetical protein